MGGPLFFGASLMCGYSAIQSFVSSFTILKENLNNTILSEQSAEDISPETSNSEWKNRLKLQSNVIEKVSISHFSNPQKSDILFEMVNSEFDLLGNLVKKDTTIEERIIQVEDSRTGKIITLKVKLDHKIGQVLDVIAEPTGIQTVQDQFNLVYKGMELSKMTTIKQLVEKFGLTSGDQMALWARIEAAAIDTYADKEIRTIKDIVESFKDILNIEASNLNNLAKDVAEFFDVKAENFLKEDISTLNDFLRRIMYGLHKQELIGLDRDTSSELFNTILKLAEAKKCEFITNPNPLQELLRVARWYYSDTINTGDYLADAEFAKILGITESTLNKYLSGTVKMIYSESNIFNIKSGISNIISKVGDNHLRQNLISSLERFNEYNIREVHKVEYHKDFFKENFRKAIDTILILQTLGSELNSLDSIEEEAFIKFKRNDPRGYSRLLHHLFQNDKLSIDPGRIAHSTYYSHSDIERLTRSPNGGEILFNLKEEIIKYIDNMEENCPKEEWNQNNWIIFKEKREFLQEKGVGEFFLEYYEELVKRYYGEDITPELLEKEIEDTINWFIEKYKDEIMPIQLPNCINDRLNLKSIYIKFIGDY